MKKRYIYFKIHCNGKLSYDNVRNTIWDGLLDFLGEYGTAKANIRIIKNLWNDKEKTGMIRCSHTQVDEVKMAMGLIHQIGDERVVFQTLKVSGTISGAKRKK